MGATASAQPLTINTPTAKTRETAGTNQPNETITFRIPNARDGQLLHRLTRESNGLDLNSPYAYMLLGSHFAESCVLAEIDGQAAGFVSAYVPPSDPDTLFVWQVAVHPDFRRRGLGLKMLEELLRRPFVKKLEWIQASITPSNTPSRRLFFALTERLNADSHREVLFPASFFGGNHEDEMLIRIGPLSECTLPKPAKAAKKKPTKGKK